jgi:hypothetical protein
MMTADGPGNRRTPEEGVGMNIGCLGFNMRARWLGKT